MIHARMNGMIMLCCMYSDEGVYGMEMGCFHVSL